MMTDVDFRAFVISWNQLQGQTTPAVHLRICDWLQRAIERDDQRLLLMAFRACGKSTIIGLFCAWMLFRQPRTRILVVAADDALATRMVRNVRRVIERHPFTSALVPGNPDQWAADRFTIERDTELRDPSMIARGASANLTGLRADLIICDDVEVPNTSDTPEKREILRDYLAELEYIRTPGARTIYVGTPHTFDTIYATETRDDISGHVPFLRDYQALRVPIVVADGLSAWPEKYSSTAIEEMRERSGPMRFQSQMMLRPMSPTHLRLNPAGLQVYNDEAIYAPELRELFIGEHRMLSASAWWDPAFGRGGDGSVVASVFTDTRGHLWIHDVLYLTLDDQSADDEATQQCRDVALRMKELQIPVLGIETNGIGRFLPTILRREIVRARTPVAVVEINNRIAKATRILQAFDAPLAARMVHIHARVLATSFIEEFRAFRPDGGGGHDDGIDAVAGAILMEPVRIPGGNGAVRRTGWRSGEIYRAKT
jgi:Terminase RNaseH-like domain